MLLKSFKFSSYKYICYYYIEIFWIYNSKLYPRHEINN